MPKEDKKLKYSISGYNSFIKNYEDESDRAVIILAISFIENYLENTLKKRLVQHKSMNKLFEGYAPLATFSAKIDIAYAIGLIPENICTELHLLRKIRNISAHEDSKIDFSDTRIMNICNNLIVSKGIKTTSNNFYKINTCRGQFLFSVLWCLIHLETQKDRVESFPELKLKFEIVDDEIS